MNEPAGRNLNETFELFKKIFNDSKNTEFRKWLKEHQSRIRKLDFDQEQKYYELVQEFIKY